MRYDKPMTQMARKTIRFLASSTRSRMGTCCLCVLISNQTQKPKSIRQLSNSSLSDNIHGRLEYPEQIQWIALRGHGDRRVNEDWRVFGCKENEKWKWRKARRWFEGFGFNARTVRFRCSSLICSALLAWGFYSFIFFSFLCAFFFSFLCDTFSSYYALVLLWCVSESCLSRCVLDFWVW